MYKTEDIRRKPQEKPVTPRKSRKTQENMYEILKRKNKGKTTDRK